MQNDESAITAEDRAKSAQHRPLPTDIWDRNKKTVNTPSSSSKRRAYFRLLLQLLCLLAIGLAIPYLAKWSYDYFYANNSDLALTNIVFETDGSLTQEQAITASGITLGTNLTQLDLFEIQERITNIAQVKSATIEREFPDSLVIKLEERRAAAWISSPIHQIRPLREGGLLIDTESVVFKCHFLSEAMLALPTIELNPIEAPEEGNILEHDVARSGLALINSNAQITEPFGLELIDIRPVGNWGLLCRYSNNLLATFDMSDLERGQQNFRKILTATDAKGLRLATINLAPRKNIPVTFHDEAKARTKKGQ